MIFHLLLHYQKGLTGGGGYAMRDMHAALSSFMSRARVSKKKIHAFAYKSAMH